MLGTLYTVMAQTVMQNNTVSSSSFSEDTIPQQHQQEAYTPATTPKQYTQDSYLDVLKQEPAIELQDPENITTGVEYTSSEVVT